MLEPIPGNPDAQVLLSTATTPASNWEPPGRQGCAPPFLVRLAARSLSSKESLIRYLQRQVDTSRFPGHCSANSRSPMAADAPHRLEARRSTAFCPRHFCGHCPKRRPEAAPRAAVGSRVDGEKFRHEPCGHHVERRRIAALAVAGGEYGFALASGVPTTNEATKELSRGSDTCANRSSAACGISRPIWFQDTAYTSAAIGPHTDGTYSIDPPLPDVHCLKFDGSGARAPWSTFQDCRRDPPLRSNRLRRAVDGQGSGGTIWATAFICAASIRDRSRHNGDLDRIAITTMTGAVRLPTPR